MSIDLEDLMVIVGVLMMAVAVYLLAGWPGLLGFSGAGWVVAGLILADRKARKSKG